MPAPMCPLCGTLSTSMDLVSFGPGSGLLKCECPTHGTFMATGLGQTWFPSSAEMPSDVLEAERASAGYLRRLRSKGN